jgi:amidase
LGSDGLMVMPTMPDIAPLSSAEESTLESYRNDAIRLLCIAGLAGLPQISLPLSQRDGAPLGISLVGPPGSDRALVAIAYALAQ